jgi:hypothetical protein
MKKLTKKCAKLIIHVSPKCKRFFTHIIANLKTEMICETLTPTLSPAGDTRCSPAARRWVPAEGIL